MNLLGNVDIRSRAIFGMEIWLLDEADEREIWNGNGMEVTRGYEEVCLESSSSSSSSRCAGLKINRRDGCTC